jgi:uncharacterized protein YbjT (DUF2867 family)
MRIAVAGATGRAGRHVVDVLSERGHEPVAMSRATGVDVITGDGLADALVGAEAIIDVATGPSPDYQQASDFFTASARNLHEAGQRAGVQRLVVVSIIGIDELTSGYQAAKLDHERAILEGPIPARVLRAAQFHEFVPELMNWGRGDDVIQVWRMRTQLVAARAVAEAAVDLATDPAAVPAPAGEPIAEIAGPREESLVEAAKLYAARTGDPARVEEIGDPDDHDQRLIDAGALLPGPHAKLAGPTFEEWLATSVAAS